MPYPIFQSGMRIRAHHMRALQVKEVLQGADQTSPNNTGLIDTNLVISGMPANANFRYWLYGSYVTTDVADIKIGLTVPTNGFADRWVTTVGRDAGGGGIQASVPHGRFSRNTSVSVIGAGGTGTDQFPLAYIETGRITTGDGGSATFQFAQRVADPFNTTWEAASFLEYIRTA